MGPGCCAFGGEADLGLNAAAVLSRCKNVLRGVGDGGLEAHAASLKGWVQGPVLSRGYP